MLGLFSGYELWCLRLSSFCGYGLALAVLALVVFGADSYPILRLHLCVEDFAAYKRPPAISALY